MDNYMKLEILAIGENESFARNAVAAFALSLNPSLTELSDIKTAVSEAVTNCILHAYAKCGNDKKIFIECRTEQTEADRRGVLHIKSPITVAVYRTWRRRCCRFTRRLQARNARVWALRSCIRLWTTFPWKVNPTRGPWFR